VELISGEREAELIYPRCVQRSLSGRASQILVVDVGGGSAEFVQGRHAGRMERFQSLPLGALRLTEKVRRRKVCGIIEVFASDVA
jgi:exopolyphosphatase/pppGpp-phosphohydrolase